MARFNEMQIVSGGASYAPGSNGYSAGTHRINSASASFAAFFQVPEAVTITHLGVSYNVRTGTPPTQRVTLREPEGDGLYSSTVLASKTFTPPADASWDGTFRWIELVNPYPASRGEKLVMVLEYLSGSVSNSNRSTYLTSIVGSRMTSGHYPYHMTNNGSQVRAGDAPVFGYKSSTRSYGLPLVGISEEVLNSPAEAGLRFLLDRGFGSSFRLLGASFIGRMAASSGQTLDLVLYNAANAVIHRVTRDCDHAFSGTVSDNLQEIYFDDATLAELEFGQEYFLVIAPNGVGTGARLRCFDLGEEEDMTALRGGAGLYLVTRANSLAAWTRSRDRRPVFADLFLDGWSA